MTFKTVNPATNEELKSFDSLTKEQTIKPEMPTYDQELFGPVACVYVVKDEQAAIRTANDSSYGLGGSVYTRDIERGQRVAEQIDTGMMFINQPTSSQAELPLCAGSSHSVDALQHL